MNELLNAIHWKKYWLSFVSFIFCLAACGFSLGFYWESKHQLQQSEMRVIQQKAINDSAEKSVLQLKNFYHQYQRLKEQGLIGEPPRLEWAEVLLEKYQNYRLPGFYFVLSPTEKATSEPDFFTSDLVEIKKTPMQISFNLLHEGDFYRYLRSLHQQAKGQFSVQECVINRDLSKIADTTDFVARFKGECEIIWLTLKDITASWPQGAAL